MTPRARRGVMSNTSAHALGITRVSRLGRTESRSANKLRYIFCFSSPPFSILDSPHAAAKFSATRWKGSSEAGEQVESYVKSAYIDRRSGDELTSPPAILTFAPSLSSRTSKAYSMSVLRDSKPKEQLTSSPRPPVPLSIWTS
jgi:hypothetical protein